jgi:putative spermidine/putrescine transport system permease protein
VIVLAISYYGIALDLHLVGSLVGFVLANTLLTAPLVALFVAASAAGVDRRLEYASLACGAGPWRTVARITLPLVAPTALAGGALAFLLSLDEVVMSLFLVSPGRTPLAVKMFLEVQTGTAPIVTAAATFLIAVSVVVVGVLTLVRGLRDTAGAVAVPPDMNAGA